MSVIEPHEAREYNAVATSAPITAIGAAPAAIAEEVSPEEEAADSGAVVAVLGVVVADAKESWGDSGSKVTRASDAAEL